MKKVISLLLAVLMLMSVVPMMASAETEGIFTYEYSNGQKILTKVSSSAKGYVIVPEGYHVIDASAFLVVEDVKVVVLPKSLKRIKTFAFNACKNLKSVIFANDATETLTIETKGFLQCHNLGPVFLPKNVKTEDSAFHSCERIYQIGVEERTNPSALHSNTVSSRDVVGLTYTGSKESWTASHCFGDLAPEFNHQHTLKEKALIEAHCNGGGFIVNGCTHCPYVDTYRTTGYNFDNHTEDVTGYAGKDPTCLNSGYTYSKKCNICNYIFDWGEYLPPLGHNMSKPRVVNPTCLSDGYTESLCVRYGCDYKEHETLPSYGGHVDNDHNGPCDNEGCGYDFRSGCGHICHKGGFFYKIALFFWKLFKISKECSCGVYHY